MTPEDFQDKLDKRETEQKGQESNKAQISAISKAGIKNVEATNANTKSTAEGLKNVRGTVTVDNPDLAKTTDLKEVTDAIHKSNLTAYMSTKGLPQLADNISSLTQKTDELRQRVQDEGLTKVTKQLVQLTIQLQNLSKTLGTTKIDVGSALQKTISDLSKKIGDIDFNPTVNVSAPKINIPGVDLSGLQSTLEAYVPKESTVLDLNEYRAQDLDQMEPGVQYVGFINQDGNWYIIKNVEQDNTLRYAFGNDAYADFWPIASTLVYTRLNEALHEVST